MHLELIELCISLSRKNDIIVNLTFPSWELLLFLISVFNYLYFRNCATNFVEIYNIYASQMVIKVAVSIISSDKLSR